MTTTIFDVTPEEIESSAVKVENKGIRKGL